jgi:hypothetical protein
MPKGCIELAASLLLVAPLAAQSPAIRALTTPERFAEPFEAVLSLRELPNGKVLLVDDGPKLLYLVDFRNGQHTPIGRRGRGPGEYQFPTELVPYLGDTTLLVDRMSRRLLPISADGKPGRVVSLPESAADFTSVRGADLRGGVFLQAELYGVSGQGEDVFQAPDSAAILRWDRSSDRIDTIARIKLPSTSTKVRSTGSGLAVSMLRQPYAGQDEWAVTLDGRVGVVRLTDYHVDWAGDRPAKGAPVIYQPVRVGPAEQAAFMAPIKERRGRSAVANDANSPPQGRRPPAPTVEDFDWPEVKPPFVPRNLFAAPEGVLWVLRSAPASDSVSVYDLFNASGNLSARIALPKGRRLVGLGKGVAYATRTDEDGLQWLERYKR